MRLKILHLAHTKSTFLLFRSNYSCLFPHSNDVALAITKLQKHWRMVVIALWTARAKLVPSVSMLRKAAWRQVWTRRQRAMYCFLQFSKAPYTLGKRNTHLKKFWSKRNWEQREKLYSFCKKLSANPVIFSVLTWEGKILACSSLTLDFCHW